MFVAGMDEADESERVLAEKRAEAELVQRWTEQNQRLDGGVEMLRSLSRRRAFRVVDEFEQALCEFTGAPFAVTVDSCTNALFLALKWFAGHPPAPSTVRLPKHTYVGVAQAVRNAGFLVEWVDCEWKGAYRLRPLPLWDCAKLFKRGMWTTGFQCVSFQASKQLPVGRGGAILHDNAEADRWLRAARFDGRTAGAPYSEARYQVPGYHVYMTPPDAARGLWLLTYLEDDDPGDWTGYPDLSVAKWD